VNLFYFIVMNLYLNGCYIVMLVLNMLSSGLVMFEYVIVWSCFGYGWLGLECCQHSGCSLSRARTSDVTPILVTPDGLARLSHATNSVYIETPGLFTPDPLA
jgi:hypothetical protein